MDALEGQSVIYHLHSGARKALLGEAIVCLLGVIFSPWSIWYLAVRRRAKIVVYKEGLKVTYFWTRCILFAEIERVGILVVPFRPRGLGGWIETSRCGGTEARHLCIRCKGGKEHHILLSQYESWEEITNVIQHGTGLRYENVSAGFASVIWPE